MKTLTLYPLPAMSLACGYNYKFYFDYTTDYRGDVLINTYYSNRLEGTIGGRAYIVANLKDIKRAITNKRNIYQWIFDDVRVVEPVALHSNFRTKVRKLRDCKLEYENLNVCPEIEDTDFKTVKDWQYKYLIPHIYGVTKSSKGYYKVHDIREYLLTG